jgi:predicted PurR-regulated permease PerM
VNQVAVFVSLLLWSWVCGVRQMLLAVATMIIVKVVCDQTFTSHTPRD